MKTDLPGDLAHLTGTTLHGRAHGYVHPRTLGKGKPEPLHVFHGMMAAYLRGAQQEREETLQWALGELLRLPPTERLLEVRDKIALRIKEKV